MQVHVQRPPHRAAGLRPARAAVRTGVVARVHRGGSRSMATPFDINVHGRHVDVTPEVASFVRQRLTSVLDKFKGAQILESDGGVAYVDVRLMNSQAEIKLQPRIHNKATGDTYVRQGGLKACESGSSWSDSLEKTLAALDKKLTKYTKPAPFKTDYRRL